MNTKIDKRKRYIPPSYSTSNTFLYLYIVYEFYPAGGAFITMLFSNSFTMCYLLGGRVVILFCYSLLVYEFIGGFIIRRGGVVL